MKIDLPVVRRHHVGCISSHKFLHETGHEWTKVRPLHAYRVHAVTVFNRDLQAKRRARGVYKLALLSALSVTILPLIAAFHITRSALHHASYAFEDFRYDVHECAASCHWAIATAFADWMDEVRGR